MFVLLLPIKKEDLSEGIDDLMDVIVLHPETGDMLTFPTKNDAAHFREINGISSKIIELFVL